MKNLFTKPTHQVDPLEDSFELPIVNTSKVFWFPRHSLWSVVELQSSALLEYKLYVKDSGQFFIHENETTYGKSEVYDLLMQPLDWGHRAACNNLLITVKASVYCL